MKLPKTVMAALAAVAALNLPASEKQQLDSYVKCGILTPSEASQISRSMAVSESDEHAPTAADTASATKKTAYLSNFIT